MCAITEAASSLICSVVSWLGFSNPIPARCLIFGEVIGSTGRALYLLFNHMIPAEYHTK